MVSSPAKGLSQQLVSGCRPVGRVCPILGLPATCFQEQIRARLILRFCARRSRAATMLVGRFPRTVRCVTAKRWYPLSPGRRVARRTRGCSIGQWPDHRRVWQTRPLARNATTQRPQPNCCWHLPPTTTGRTCGMPHWPRRARESRWSTEMSVAVLEALAVCIQLAVERVSRARTNERMQASSRIPLRTAISKSDVKIVGFTWAP